MIVKYMQHFDTALIQTVGCLSEINMSILLGSPATKCDSQFCMIYHIQMDTFCCLIHGPFLLLLLFCYNFFSGPVLWFAKPLLKMVDSSYSYWSPQHAGSRRPHSVKRNNCFWEEEGFISSWFFHLEVDLMFSDN